MITAYEVSKNPGAVSSDQRTICGEQRIGS